jgi:hypothetical protein
MAIEKPLARFFNPDGGTEPNTAKWVTQTILIEYAKVLASHCPHHIPCYACDSCRQRLLCMPINDTRFGKWLNDPDWLDKKTRNNSKKVAKA